MSPFATAADSPAKDADAPGACLYDTVKSPEDGHSDEEVAARSGWQLLPEDDLTHKFNGDVALANEALTVVLRRWAVTAGVCSRTADGTRCRGEIGPVPPKGVSPRGGIAVRILENTRAAVEVRATYQGNDNKPISVTYRLTTGQSLVEAKPGDGARALFVGLTARWTVIPEFLGDDMAFGPDASDRHRLGLPTENVLLHLVGKGDAMVLCVWPAGRRRTEGLFALKEPEPRIAGCQIEAEKDKPLWVAFLEGRGLWHERPVAPPDAGREVALDWKPSFAARWRADFVGQDGACRSVTFEDLAAGPAVPPKFRGSMIVYPIDRSRTTPLTVLTPMDIMRNTLGVGPCQYILDAEGLGGGEAATPAFVMDWIEKQLKKKKSADAAEEIRARLKAMTEHVARTQARIKRYADFAAEAEGLLASAAAAEKLRAPVADLKARAAAGLAATQPPDRAARLAEAIVGAFGKEGAGADLERAVADVRAIGAAQDRALAGCRMATRWLRCQCLDIAESEVVPTAPGLAEAAKRIQARAEGMLQAK